VREGQVAASGHEEEPRPNSYYVCVYLKDGQALAHAGNLANDFPETWDAKAASSSNAGSGMNEITTKFINTMMGYLEYVPLILQITPVVSHKMVSTSLQTFLDSVCVSCDRASDRNIYTLRMEDFPAFRRFDENLSAAASTSRALPRMLTVGLVTSLEYHINLLMKEIAQITPTKVFGNKNIPVSLAVSFSSMDELKERLINEEIDRAQRESFDDQISWVIDKTEDMEDFRAKYPDWPKILELFERRNLFVHSNGIVNRHYVSAMQEYKPSDGKIAEVGDELHAGPKYYTNSVRAVFHFGVMLLQVVWRKLIPGEVTIADKSLGDLGYELIARGQYKLAVSVLEFAKNLRGTTDDVRKRMNIINLANAYKLDGDEKRAIQVLDSLGWGAAGTEYKISVAAIRSDVEEVVRLMQRIGSTDAEVGAQEYQQWPVFYHVRDDGRFIEMFKSIFGIDYIPSDKKQAGIAQVMKWTDENASRENLSADDHVTLQPQVSDIES
jgi:uncharacterized small protein (DUF1192 family)